MRLAQIRKRLTAEQPIVIQPISIPTAEPSKDDWKLFRKIEKTFAPHKPRTRTGYNENVSAAIGFPNENITFIIDNEKNHDKLLDVFAENIIEHAARRIDLFFYVLVAYYKQDIPPILGWTKLQHGKGKINFTTKEGITHAAHSSFTPSIIDRTILNKIPLISSLSDNNLKIKTSILCDKHLMDGLNSTVEMPAFINEFDFLLEFTCQGRDKSSKIIRDVSTGKIDPIEGITQFLVLLKSIFDNMHQNEQLFTIKTVLDLDVKRKLLALEEKGTFSEKLCVETNRVFDKYIYMLLRLIPDEIEECRKNSTSKKELLEKKLMAIQTEIFTSQSIHIKRVP